MKGVGLSWQFFSCSSHETSGRFSFFDFVDAECFSGGVELPKNLCKKDEALYVLHIHTWYYLKKGKFNSTKTNI